MLDTRLHVMGEKKCSESKEVAVLFVLYAHLAGKMTQLDQIKLNWIKLKWLYAHLAAGKMTQLD